MVARGDAGKDKEEAGSPLSARQVGLMQPLQVGRTFCRLRSAAAPSHQQGTNGSGQDKQSATALTHEGRGLESAEFGIALQ